MKGNNIYFAKSAVWGVFKCILQWMQSASQIRGCSGRKAKNQMAICQGWKSGGKMQWRLTAHLYSGLGSIL